MDPICRSKLKTNVQNEASICLNKNESQHAFKIQPATKKRWRDW